MESRNFIENSKDLPDVVVLVGEKASKEERKKRVAAYCRVSTEFEMQLQSLENQISTYEKVINSHSDWQFAGIYRDEGLSGTNAVKRTKFLQMIEDAQRGKIDVIMVKSISRFARNTVIALQYIRLLKSFGTTVIFEKENIDTSQVSSEFILTVLAAFAQEESRSISENTKRGIRNLYKMGRPRFSNIFGYSRGYEIIETEAEIVRLIFSLFVGGNSIGEISDILYSKGIKSPKNQIKWHYSTLRKMLSNEKYVGDVLMQKSYTTDHITHHTVKNKGKVEQYYLKNHHRPIVDRLVFEKVQDIIAKRRYQHGNKPSTGKG